MVNGTFRVPAASLPCFWQKVAAIDPVVREFRSFAEPYGATLLTMIKIVLIVTISFASPSQ
jgi:hypothetical protein